MERWTSWNHKTDLRAKVAIANMLVIELCSLVLIYLQYDVRSVHNENIKVPFAIVFIIFVQPLGLIPAVLTTPHSEAPPRLLIFLVPLNAYLWGAITQSLVDKHRQRLKVRAMRMRIFGQTGGNERNPDKK